MLFLFIYWLLFIISTIALFGCIAASTTMGLRFRESAQDISSMKPVPSLSMIVPLKGIDDFTSSHLNALVESVLDIPVEYLFAMESIDDPAFAVCQKVKEQHPEKDIHVILSGPAIGRMGKQHNLLAATQEAALKLLVLWMLMCLLNRTPWL